MSLPNSWVMTPLSNLLDRIVGGGTPSKSIAANFIGKVPFMTVKDMKARFIADTVDHISEDALSSSATTKIPADTLVVATRMSLGKIVRPSSEVAINQDLKALFPFAGVNKTYIEYFWRSKSDFIQSIGTGTTVKGIRIEDIKNLEVPLAPETEQRRIADKLDTTLARVDALNDRLARITPLLKRFRQSVLAAAVTGKLSDKNEIPWNFEKLKKISKRVSVGHVGVTSKYYCDKEEGIPFLRSQNIRPGRMDFSGIVYITNEFHRSLKKSQIIAGDLLVVRVGANRGDSCIVPKDFDGELNCANIVFARPLPEFVKSRYLEIYFQSPQCQEILLGASVGGAQGVINTSVVGNIDVPLPSLQEQAEIVRRVEALFAFADRLQARLQSAQTAAERLTPALLAKAFRGELVPQDPHDEPATELLRRLREARAAEARIKPKRGRKAAAT
ncbi:restriction endonuclease subunit S [Comamonas aquatica]|uniref:restriction endonuclease subunit S n=1 Tax=Comamonas aquatica TaxID=225991 RepID=UPI0021B145BB|nr:restriction endonuclease subunit S [Comamonas aquatica]